jgi:integrase
MLDKSSCKENWLSPIGIMEKLLDEKKLTQLIYRSPYATRHTFITRQINAGVPLDQLGRNNPPA